MKNLQEVLIIHGKHADALSIYFEKFNEWIGLAIAELIYEPDSSESLNEILGVENRFDLIQIIGDVPKSWYQDVDAGVIVKIEKESIWKDGIIQSSLLKNVWKEILTKLKFESAWKNFEKLIDIYCENNLLHTMYHIHNYYKNCNSECENKDNCLKRHFDRYYIWKNVRDELQPYMLNQEEFYDVGLEYVHYALVYVCAEMNHICYQACVEEDYDEYDLLGMTAQINLYDYDFYMRFYLEHLIALQTSSNLILRFASLNACIKYSKTNLCKSNFSLAEANLPRPTINPKKAEARYKKSYNLNKRNYKALFNLARFHYKNKEYPEATHFVNLALKILENSEEPIKLLYKCKSLDLLATIQRQQNQNLYGLANLYPFYQKILTSVQNVPFFDEMFINEEDKKFFSECLKSKISIKIINGMYENSKKARKKIMSPHK